MKIVWPALGACALPHVGGLLGSVVVQRNYESWYLKLEKPKWTPPRVVFPVVWTTLYTGMGYASYLVWREGGGFNGLARIPLTLYGTQLALNWAWAPIFFGLHSHKLALVDGWLCYIMVVATTASFWKINKTAAYLMIPYVAWMTFASFISFTIRKQNPEKPLE